MVRGASTDKNFRSGRALFPPLFVSELRVARLACAGQALKSEGNIGNA
jgi:hypothetical protein